MNISIQTFGGEELARRLNALSDEMSGQAIGQALQSGGALIRDLAVARMKRSADAPHAADHVRMQLGRSKHSIAIGPSGSFYYWLFQEYGTVHHRAQPALRPAFDERAPAALNRIGQELWAAIRASAASGPSIGSRTTETFL